MSSKRFRVCSAVAAIMFVLSAQAHAVSTFPFKGKAGMGMGSSSSSNPSPPNPPGPRAQRSGVRSGASQWLASAHPHPLEGEGSHTDHATMGHDVHPSGAATVSDLPPDAPPITPIPPITAADRRAAFPDVDGHTLHDNAIHSFCLLDRLESWDAEPGAGVGWDAMSWIGTDLNRIWLRTEGEYVHSTTKSADIEVLYGRAVTPWWDLVAGLRHDFGENPSQTFAAIGVQGLAPYKFEVAATAYLGQGGQTAARLEIAYETLFTNRLILQWQIEADLYGQHDAQRGIDAGLSTLEAGLRLRYEFTRQFAPYIGIVHERAYGGTADLRQAKGGDVDSVRWVLGLRTWF